jgi:4'-phosphopantetheinyl transferase
MEAFFRCWTRKEAFIKALGMGLSIPLDSFTVSTSLTEPPALLHYSQDTNTASHWSFIHLEPTTGYIGAIAIEKSGWSALQFAWP